MRRRRSRLVRLGFGAAFGVLLLYVAEVGLRLAGVSAAYQGDLIGGWRMMPEMHAQQMIAAGQHPFLLTTNADGMRTSLARARSPGVRRVAVMGDSTVFGWGVDEGGALSDGIAEGLAARPELGPVEVLNAAQPGYSTTQIARFYREVVRHYTPDLLVVFLPMHDGNHVLVSDREYLEGGRGAGRVRVLLAEHSRLYQLLRQAVFPMSDKAFLVPGREESPEPRVPRVSDDERAENLAAIRAGLAETGGALAIGHVPFHADLTGQGGERFTTRWATPWAAANGVPVVDLRACCGTDAGDLVLPWDPGHLTAAGNLRAGRFAAGRIGALLDQGSSR